MPLSLACRNCSGTDRGTLMTQPSDGFGLHDEAAGSEEQPAQSAVGYCTNCGMEYNAGEAYCGRCGRPLGQNQPRQEFSGLSPNSGRALFPSASGTTYPGSRPAFGPTDNEPYGSGATIGAGLHALVIPLISL